MEVYKQIRPFREIGEEEKFIITRKDKHFLYLKVYPRNTSLSEISKNKAFYTRVRISKLDANRYLTMYCYGIWDYSIEPGYKRQPKWSEPLSKDDLNKELKDIKERMGENDELYIYKKYGVAEQGQIAINAKVKHGNKLENIYLLRVDLL